MSTRRKIMAKLILLGDSGVGKTCIIERYINNSYSNNTKSTIGADFLCKEILIDDCIIMLQIWDTAGQEKFKSLGISFYRGSDCCVLVYDVNIAKSFENLDFWYQQFLNMAVPKDETMTFPFVVIGNKIDVSPQRAVSKAQGEEWCKQKAVAYMETSAKSAECVDDVFRKVAEIVYERNREMRGGDGGTKRIEEKPKEDDECCLGF